MCVTEARKVNSLRSRRDRRHFADDIFKCVFLNENAWVSLRISLKFVPKVRINNIPSLVQIMAWRRPGDKPLSESMVVSLPTHICVTRPQWVKYKTLVWPLIYMAMPEIEWICTSLSYLCNGEKCTEYMISCTKPLRWCWKHLATMPSIYMIAVGKNWKWYERHWLVKV